MSDPFQLAEVLGRYVERSGYTPGQLARLTGVPKATIVNWLDGRVRRPRARQDLIRLAAVMHLTEPEASELLRAASHLPIPDLLKQAQHAADGDMLALLDPWLEAVEGQPARPPFQAPPDLPHFVGREAELRALKEALLADRHSGVISLQGMAGVGKTTLAAHLAYELRAHFPDGVLWAGVDTSDTLSILGTFAGAFGIDVRTYLDVDSRSRVVRELLADKAALIVLDNAEGSEQIRPLLPPTGRCAVVVTTRRHDLAVTRGGRRFDIRPFNAEQGESLALFSQILGAERVADEREALLTLADLLGHLPLAVDIAASRLAYEPGWSAADFLWRVQRQDGGRLRELSFESQSVRLSFDASYGALEPATGRFFAALAVFSGEDFSPDAAAAVANVPLDKAQDLLRRLYALSLVRQGRPGRYRLHQLLRDYARDHLPEGADESEPTRRMVRHYVDLVAERPRDYDRLEQEMSDIRAALDAALDRAAGAGMAAAFIRGAIAFYPFLEARGLYDLARGYLTRAYETAVEQDEAAGLMAAVHSLGRVAQRYGDYIEAETRYEEALELARAVGDEAQMSDLLRSLGVLAARRGDMVLAEAYYKEGVALARRLYAPGGSESDLLRGLGVQAYIRGDYEGAEAFYEEGLALLPAGADGDKIGSMLWGMGALAEEQGDAAQAARYFAEGLARARRIGHRERELTLLMRLGRLAFGEGGLDRAAGFYDEALALAREIGHRWRTAVCLSQQGEIYLQRGETAAARQMFDEVYEIARIVGSQPLVAAARYGLARVAEATDEADRAREYGRESLSLYELMADDRADAVREWLGGL